MIVRLTTGQEAALLQAVAHDAEMVEALSVDRRQQVMPSGTLKGRIDIYAPYAAWLFARETLLDRAFNHRGYRAKGVPSTVQAAVKAISQALGFVDRHPALRGVGTIGHHPIVFHVWRLETVINATTRFEPLGGLAYTPYPHPDLEFVVLAPTWHTGTGRTKTTTWSAEGVRPGEDRLSQEAVHQVLWRAGIARTRDEYVGRLSPDES